MIGLFVTYIPLDCLKLHITYKLLLIALHIIIME